MPEPVATNIRVLNPSRRRLQTGDIFTIGLPHDTFMHGRVIAVDLPRERAPMPGANLIYIYAAKSDSKQPHLESLTPEALLVPPLFINRLPWSRGYFETVAHQPLREDDMLSAHYFWSASRAKYVDEHGNVLDFVPAPPVGDWGLHSFRTVDDLVSAAVGIAPAPDDS